MQFEPAMDLVTRLLTQAQALAAFAAHLRLTDEEIPADPALRQKLHQVVDLLGVDRATEELDRGQRAILVGFARSYLRQALELLEDPGRPGAWVHEDPALLQAQGAASAVVASIFRQAGLGRPDARILDIGTGVGRLAIAFCEAYPQATVVGIDPWAPALELARRNVADARLESRVTLKPMTIEALHDAEGFDLVWLPSFFIPEPVIDEALRSVVRHARPGATLVVGVPEHTDDALTGALDDLMTIRSGGTVLTPDQAIARMERAGFGEVRQMERTWRAPIRLIAGRQVGQEVVTPQRVLV